MKYHATNWPLWYGPSASELHFYLRRDYGLSDVGSDADLEAAYAAAGHTVEDAGYFQRVQHVHCRRRYEAQTGNPF